MQIRTARLTDAEAIRGIYNCAILAVATFDLEPRSLEEQQQWLALRSGAHLVLVALSGRNQLRGIVDEIRSDGLLAQVRLRIGSQILTAIITTDAVRELKLTRGDEAVAIIKSTEVMIGREQTDEDTNDMTKPKKR